MKINKSIIFIITGLSYGGAEIQLIYLVNNLKKRGWKVAIISIMPPKAFMDELERAGITVISLNISRKLPDPWPILKLAQHIKRWQPNIIHSHMFHANIFARLVRFMVWTPVLICSAHSIDERGRKNSGWLRKYLYMFTDSLCDLTTQVSQAGVERYTRIGAVPPHKIRYVPNGVDTEKFCVDPEAREELRKELGLNKVFVWLAVGRFAIPKDYPTMLRAFTLVLRKYPKTTLLIAGDGPLRRSMETFAKDLFIGSHVKFLGIRRDIPKLMNAADAYVMSSAWEGMSLVLLEAHATGLPVVATDVGGNREVVLQGKTGFLVSPKNPEALAQAMLNIMSLPEEERRKMGETARRHIEANFKIDRIVDQWETLYHELLSKKAIYYEGSNYK